MMVYEKRPIQECMQRTGRRPIPVRWIDVNKGDKCNEVYRSRLVAKDYNTGKRDDLFAATPPVECLRMVLSAATVGPEPKAVMVNDLSRAYMYSDCKQEAYVQLPKADVKT